MLLICEFHFKSWLMVTPRYLLVCSLSNVCPWNLYGVTRGLLLLVTWITVHFSGFNDICQSFSHFSSAARSSCRVMVSWRDVIRLYKRESSAKSRMSDLVQSGMSLMKVRNRRGPRTVPCGTPERTSAVVDVFPSMMSLCKKWKCHQNLNLSCFFAKIAIVLNKWSYIYKTITPEKWIGFEKGHLVVDKHNLVKYLENLSLLTH